MLFGLSTNLFDLKRLSKARIYNEAPDAGGLSVVRYVEEVLHLGDHIEECGLADIRVAYDDQLILAVLDCLALHLEPLTGLFLQLCVKWLHILFYVLIDSLNSQFTRFVIRFLFLFLECSHHFWRRRFYHDAYFIN